MNDVVVEGLSILIAHKAVECLDLGKADMERLLEAGKKGEDAFVQTCLSIWGKRTNTIFLATAKGLSKFCRDYLHSSSQEPPSKVIHDCRMLIVILKRIALIANHSFPRIKKACFVLLVKTHLLYLFFSLYYHFKR